MKMQLSDDDLLTNPSPRVPVVLCLDTSGSMSQFIGGTRPIDELNSGLQKFYDSIRADEMALYSAEIAIVTFGNKGVQTLQNFELLNDIVNPPSLIASGLTPMSEAVELAISMLDKRKEEYKNAGVEYFQPWLVLMTDGKPDNRTSAQNVGRDCVTLIEQKKLVIFPIAIGNEADLSCLNFFTVKDRKPLKLQGLNFGNFFQWLSASISSTSTSSPGDRISLDMEGLRGWAEL